MIKVDEARLQQLVQQLTDRRDMWRRSREAFRRLDMPFEARVAELRARHYSAAISSLPSILEAHTAHDALKWMRAKLQTVFVNDETVGDRAASSRELIDDMIEKVLQEGQG